MAASSAPASAADYFAGKTIDFLVGADAGGGYDIYARTVARHWGKYIPGHPTFVVRNLPGAGSGRAAVYISTVAPSDGTALDPLRFGVEACRPTLEIIIDYCVRQGLIPKKIEVDALFDDVTRALTP